MTKKQNTPKDPPALLITYRAIKDLILSDYNPRRISATQLEDLKESLQRFGFVEPVVVNMHEKRKNIVISGHQRLKVATSLGIKNVPTHQVKLTLAKERELNIRLNKSGGDFDEALLEQFFNPKELQEWGFDDFGEDGKPKDPQKATLQPFKKTHILLSFPPHLILELQPHLEEIIKIEGIEYEQSSN